MLPLNQKNQLKYCFAILSFTDRGCVICLPNTNRSLPCWSLITPPMLYLFKFSFTQASVFNLSILFIGGFQLVSWSLLISAFVIVILFLALRKSLSNELPQDNAFGSAFPLPSWINFCFFLPYFPANHSKFFKFSFCPLISHPQTESNNIISHSWLHRDCKRSVLP